MPLSTGIVSGDSEEMSRRSPRGWESKMSLSTGVVSGDLEELSRRSPRVLILLMEIERIDSRKFRVLMLSLKVGYKVSDLTGPT